MRDRILIYAGLCFFVALVTFPVWRGVAAHSSTRGPELKAPVGQACVAPRTTMREKHMDLLMEWRDAKVRLGERRYVAADGKSYAISLSGTCLNQCHGSKDQFCDRCHQFAGVPVPDCWGCHLSPAAEPARVAAVAAGVKL